MLSPSLRSSLGLVALVLASAPAPATAQTTLDRTIRPAEGGRSLTVGPGEGHLVRTAPRLKAAAGRAARRRSLTYFAHLTDLHVVDETSPGRLDFLRAGGGGQAMFQRPQEAMSTQVADQAVRAVNANAVSPVSGARGQRARLGFAVASGDFADNAQVNEVRWALRTLNGGRLVPFSGVAATRRNCRAAPAALAATRRDVGQRRYTGLQDRADWPALRRDSRLPIYDPNVDSPDHPGLLDAAQQPFVAKGLDVPWYSVRGNHDTLSLGSYSARRVGSQKLATGCRKAFPGRKLSPGANPWALLRSETRRGPIVAPDPARRRVRSSREFRSLHGRADRAHGYGLTSAAQRRASRGSALYYTHSPRPGLRFVALDTAASGDGPGGQVDHPQYLWLKQVLQGARQRGERVVVTGHHPLEMMRNRMPDELPGAGDTDPRPSLPMHLGQTGRASLRSLLLAHPNVVLYLTGHKHNDAVTPHFRRSGTGFWQVVTSSLISAPQQARLMELMDNADGTLSIFTTMVDHAAPVRAQGPASRMGSAGLASVSRSLAWTFRQGRPTTFRQMRNTELVVRDPVRGRR